MGWAHALINKYLSDSYVLNTRDAHRTEETHNLVQGADIQQRGVINENTSNVRRRSQFTEGFGDCFTRRKWDCVPKDKSGPEGNSLPLQNWTECGWFNRVMKENSLLIHRAGRIGAGPKNKAAESVGRWGAVRSSSKDVWSLLEVAPLRKVTLVALEFMSITRRHLKVLREVNILRSVFRMLSLSHMWQFIEY